ISVLNVQQPSSYVCSKFRFLLHLSHHHRVLVAYGGFVLVAFLPSNSYLGSFALVVSIVFMVLWNAGDEDEQCSWRTVSRRLSS
ncbi:hypothetical protein A2U01_0016182, partial [Trifolium medium]|nr:hypothetical protein [Trifolium medium]